MTDEKLKEIEERAAMCAEGVKSCDAEKYNKSARTRLLSYLVDVPTLIAEVRRLRALLRSLRAMPLPLDVECIANCTCYLDCGQDSHSGRWHTHEGDPCPVHPQAEMVG